MTPGLGSAFQYFPPAASVEAGRTDSIFFAMLVACGAVILLVTALIVGFSIRYRRGSKASRRQLPGIERHSIEIGWTVATLLFFIAIFGWASVEYLPQMHPPVNPEIIHISAKQWMWKVRHAGGQGEINHLHVPMDRPVELVMHSQDVIHSFYVPAFRLKQDVVPGLTERLWFTADKIGTYHLFCAEYCGTAHSHMIGSVTVMPPHAYAEWLENQPQATDLARQGEGLFTTLGCSGCHAPSSNIRAPDLHGVYGRRIKLSDGSIIVADEAYIRDSILKPKSQIVAGFPPIMPSFAGVVDNDDLIKLITYIKSLGSQETK